jgi:hypothetical protein
MGLDTTHGAFNGAYSSFYRFRDELSKLVNELSTGAYSGYGGSIPFARIEDDGIRRLLDQSDCDGEISPEDCKLIADSLDKFLDKMDPESELYSRSLQFRDGCLLAHSKGETLEFM